MGFDVTHVYGLTEVYGPAAACAWQEEWDELPLASRRADGAPGRALPVQEG
jgi:fatty-acyl-CoA synthase